MTLEKTHGEYSISTDRQKLDLPAIHAFLSRSYWSPGIPIEIVEHAIANSLCFGVFHVGEQIGLARVITDKATFAYLSDVYILESHRGKGLSKWLVETILEHEELQNLRRFMLVTKDAHTLYQRFGFTEQGNPSRTMEILKPDPYRAP
jgi:GNAT superfamily N-acetyltransferase